jgi:hypothetical protein
MELIHVAAALASAALHAGWNAAVKASPRPRQAMTAQMAMGAALVVPGLAWTGLPAPAAWGWIAASTALNWITVTALLRAYRLAGFGLVYPLVRALSVLLVVPAAALLSGETLTPAGLAGVGLIAASLLLLAADNRAPGGLPRTGLMWTLLAATATAAYVMCDAQGVRRAGSPLAYGFVVSVTNAGLMLLMERSRKAGAWRGIGADMLRAAPIAVAAVASYLLILWVWSAAPIAPAAALRDTSAVLAILIAVVWLKEPFTRSRLGAVLLAAAAVPLLRLA